MNDRFFLDTNVLVYTFDPSSPAKATRAQALVGHGVRSRLGAISYQVAQEFFAVMLRRFEHPARPWEAAEFMDAVLRPLWRVDASPMLLAEALGLISLHRLPWYDALIVAAALEAECAVLYSEDFQDGRRFGPLRVENPFI